MHYLQGLLQGLLYVAPLGVQNIFLFHTALTQSRDRAMLTARILAFFDVALIFSGFFGVGKIVERFLFLQRFILLAGGLILLGLGLGMIFSRSTPATSFLSSFSLRTVALQACAVTWLNPKDILNSTLLFGSLRTSLPTEEGFLYILGVSSGSVLWFLGISSVISKFAPKLKYKLLRPINLIFGWLMLYYGAKLLYMLFINMGQ